MLWEKWRLVATLPKSIDWLLNSAPPYSSRVATRGGGRCKTNPRRRLAHRKSGRPTIRREPKKVHGSGFLGKEAFGRWEPKENCRGRELVKRRNLGFVHVDTI